MIATIAEKLNLRRSQVDRTRNLRRFSQGKFFFFLFNCFAKKAFSLNSSNVFSLLYLNSSAENLHKHIWQAEIGKAAEREFSFPY